MAPEQARGKAVDRRADIWAFGVVVYEMLTGRRPFDGDDISVTLASVLKDEVSWQALPADLPVPVRRMLRRCLEKDPRLRLSAIGDARLELDEAGAPADRDGVRDAPVATRVVGWGRAVPWVIATAAIALAIAAIWVPRRPTASSVPLRVSADLGADVPLANQDFGAVTILSPDSDGGRVRRPEHRRPSSTLRPAPLSASRDAAVGNRRRRQPVLLSRRTVDRIFRCRKAEEDLRHRRDDFHHLRGTEWTRRRLG